MKKKIAEVAEPVILDLEGKKISRKAAIKKAGYIALSAATMMMLLHSNNAQAASPSTPPAW